MGLTRKKKERHEKRERVDVTIPGNLLEWIDGQVKDRIFATRSHAVEKALLELKKNRPP